MTFIVVLVSLLVERFFDWSHSRQWGWYGAAERIITKKFTAAPPIMVLVGSIVPLVVGLAILEQLLRHVLIGFPLMVLQLVVVLYCYGPRNLWADAYSSITSLTTDHGELVADKMRNAFNLTEDQQPESLRRLLLSQIFRTANQRIFAVVFWFIILGAPGALLYRLLSVSAETAVAPAVVSTARTAVMYMDWLPVRLMTFFFALGGNFTRVLAIWRKKVMMGVDGNDAIAIECGLAGITDNSEKLVDDGSLERSAVSLLDRSFIMIVVLDMVFTVIF